MSDSAKCNETAVYCGETLKCRGRFCNRSHEGFSHRYGVIYWSDEKRPQPAGMFIGWVMGTMYGSHQADSMMVAASTMQDAANRIEFSFEKIK